MKSLFKFIWGGSIFTILFSSIVLGESITNIDLNNYDTTKLIACTHPTKIASYDNNQHFKICSSCGQKFDIENHNLNYIYAPIPKDDPINGEHGTQAYLCSVNQHNVIQCSCGYSKDNRTNHDFIDTGIAITGALTPLNMFYGHGSYRCTRCGAADKQLCTHNGQPLNCTNPGVCDICGQEYKAYMHSYNCDQLSDAGSYEMDIMNYNNSSREYVFKCGRCHEQIYVLSNLTLTEFNPTFSIKGHIKFYNNYGASGSESDYSMQNINDSTYYSNVVDTSSGGPKLTISNYTGIKNTEFDFTIDGSYANLSPQYFSSNAIGIRLHFANALFYDGKRVKDMGSMWQFIDFYNLNQTENDKIKPTIKDYIETDLNPKQLDGHTWITNKKLQFNLTDNASKRLRINIKDDNNVNYYSGTFFTTWNNSENIFKCNTSPIIIEPKLESGNLPTKFYINVIDDNNNIQTKTLEYTYLDASPPQFVNSSDYKSNWAKSKDINIQVKENGSGNTQITFNDKDSFQIINKENNLYTRKYTITGDVYNGITIRAYAKDGLDQLAYQDITIDKIDNTIPNITNVASTSQEEGKKVKVNVTSDDKHITKGEGSGVKSYKIKRIN